MQDSVEKISNLHTRRENDYLMHTLLNDKNCTSQDISPSYKVTINSKNDPPKLKGMKPMIMIIHEEVKAYEGPPEDNLD